MKYVKLKDITTKITKGTTPSNIGASFTDEGVNYFRSEMLGKSKYLDKSSGLMYISESTHNKLKRSQINPGDILFSMAGIYLGKLAIVQEEDVPANTNQAVALIRFDRNVNIDYLYYFMSQRSFNSYVNCMSAQAAQPNINLKQIGNLQIALPTDKQQKKIADILSVYDNLIENNKKRIKILEQMAENIYKEWFVRFRFPGYEDAEFDNGVPKNWEYSKLINFIDVRYGKDHKSIEEGTIPILGSGGIMRYGDRALYNGEAVLIPRKGSLNNIMYINGDFWTVDTLFYSIPKIKNIARYLYFTFKYFDMDSLNSGASIPSMTTDIIYHLKMRQPDATVLEMFDEVLKPIYEEMDILGKQNDSIKNQRDMLLPRLMSGKLEV